MRSSERATPVASGSPLPADAWLFTEPVTHVRRIEPEDARASYDAVVVAVGLRIGGSGA